MFTKHFRILLRWGWVVGVLLLGYALWAQGEKTENVVPPMGIIDMQRLFEEYQEFQRENTKFQQYVQELQTQLKERQDHIFLTSEEWEEFLTLREKQSLNEQERTRLRELNRLTMDRDRRLEELRSKEALTKEEEKEKEQLERIFAQAKTHLQEMLDKVNKEAARVDKELSSRLEQKIQAAVRTVAQKHSLALVVDKNIRGLFVINPVEVTDEVLGILNAGEAAEEATEQPAEGAGAEGQGGG